MKCSKGNHAQIMGYLKVAWARYMDAVGNVKRYECGECRRVFHFGDITDDDKRAAEKAYGKVAK